MVTLATHSYPRALLLKSILESEGIDVVLQNVNMGQPMIGGVRVRIREEDLPLALRIVENVDLYHAESATKKEEKKEASPLLLVPVDFSPHSNAATEIAMAIAAPLHARVKLLHTFLDPLMPVAMQLSDELAYQDEVESAVEVRQISAQANKQMSKFAAEVRKRMETGELPSVRFTTQVIEGAAEDVIENTARQVRPALIVMGTRGADRHEREWMGSVTAEVLDSARFPVFTVPDTATDIHAIRNVMLLSMLDRGDIIALDTLQNLLPRQRFNVSIYTLFKHRTPVNEADAQQKLLAHCRQQYPDYTFSDKIVKLQEPTDNFSKLGEAAEPDLLLVPSHRKNLIARLFNPGIAHRLLFQSFKPMVVVPI